MYIESRSLRISTFKHRTSKTSKIPIFFSFPWEL